jgi:hypothetical protein
MRIAAFARLTQSLCNRLGEPARLRGEVVDPVLLINIEQGVEILGVYGDTVVVKDVATFPSATNPKKGDLFETLDITDPLNPVALHSYVLDAVLNDSGYSVRYVLVDA